MVNLLLFCHPFLLNTITPAAGMPISVTFEIWSIIKLFNGDIIRQILFLSPISSKSKGIKYKHILFPKPVGKFPTTLLPFKIAEIILACSSFKLNSNPNLFLIFKLKMECTLLDSMVKCTKLYQEARKGVYQKIISMNENLVY